MYIFNDISDTYFKEDCVLCLGDFDGVHIGHKQLMVTAKTLAQQLNCKMGIYTFSVNSKIVLGAKNISLLSTDSEKNKLFSEFGVDFICYDDFLKIKDLSPDDFCTYLSKNTGIKAVVCGENYTFGKYASGKSSDLKALMKSKGVECAVVPGYSLNGRSVSSTCIRNMISQGEMDSAAEMLGYRYFIETEVVHGARLGRKLGFPTINQQIYGNKIIPAFGVYCCICTVDSEKYAGVVNVGTKPTVSKSTKTDDVVFETNIIDFSGNLYGKTVKIEFYKMLRREKKFNSLDELKNNVLLNIEESRDFFRKDGLLN